MIILKGFGCQTFSQTWECVFKRIENRITFKLKGGYKIELLVTKKQTLLGSSKTKIKKNGEKAHKVEVSDVVLVHLNLANNKYVRETKVHFTSAP